jgi:hypothetical protein
MSGKAGVKRIAALSGQMTEGRTPENYYLQKQTLLARQTFHSSCSFS